MLKIRLGWGQVRELGMKGREEQEVKEPMASARAKAALREACLKLSVTLTGRGNSATAEPMAQ